MKTKDKVKAYDKKMEKVLFGLFMQTAQKIKNAKEQKEDR